MYDADDEFDVAWCRSQFPALQRKQGGQPVIYFDGPAGSQVPRQVADAVHDYLLCHNANSHGVFATSRETDGLIEAAQIAVADLLGTTSQDCVIFGPNMTTLTLAFSRAIARTWKKGDEVVVTRLDHDANITPWLLAARDHGVTVRAADVDVQDCTLDMQDLESKITPRTKLVAVGCASNSVGTINRIEQIVDLAHAQGAEVFLDAVHYAPHALMSVDQWRCDYLAASAYKFFGPHVGVLWGHRERLEEISAYKVRPASNTLPHKWMTGTQNHEGIAGTLAAIEYLADLGRRCQPQSGVRRECLTAAFRGILRYEQRLVARLLAGLAGLKQVRVWGIADPARCEERVPTVSITHAKLSSAELAERLDSRGIYAWHGNYYAVALTELLGLEPAGMVRIGLLHYNTTEEVDRLLGVLEEFE